MCMSKTVRRAITITIENIGVHIIESRTKSIN